MLRNPQKRKRSKTSGMEFGERRKNLNREVECIKREDERMNETEELGWEPIDTEELYAVLKKSQK